METLWQFIVKVSWRLPKKTGNLCILCISILSKFFQNLDFRIAGKTDVSFVQFFNNFMLFKFL